MSAPAAARVTPIPGRIPALDGIRAISIAFVIVGHMVSNPSVPRVFYGIRDFADLGVRIFFVLSGFLITSLLLSEARKHGKISLRNFYLRRVCRIFPASYTYIGCIALLAAAGAIELRQHDLSAALFYWMNFHHYRGWWLGHLWSLSVEEQFYLIWPAVLAVAGWKGGRWVCAAVICFSPVLRLVTYDYFEPYKWLIGSGVFFFVADGLAFGCLLAGIREDLEASTLYRKVCTIPVATLLFLSAMYAVKLGDGHPRWTALFLYTWMNFSITFWLHACVIDTKSAFSKLLNYRPVAFIGTLSYSLYLWQQLFLNYHQDALVRNPLIGILLSLVAAIGSYYLIERYFLQLKDRLFH